MGVQNGIMPGKKFFYVNQITCAVPLDIAIRFLDVSVTEIPVTYLMTLFVTERPVLWIDC
jgi:hypothetical protein